MKKDEPLVILDSARTPEQLEIMRRIEEEGNCPFCCEHLQKYHSKPILIETKFWLLTDSKYPYSHTRHHLLAIIKRHVTNVDNMYSEEGADLFVMLRQARGLLSIEGGAIGLRFGSPKLSGSSVGHLHAHIISPDDQTAEFVPVPFYIGAKPQ
jgi:diadenosine tetraphosphate (Ap4A) HIT family hydrolase